MKWDRLTQSRKQTGKIEVRKWIFEEMVGRTLNND